jgi:hypothetical protein
MIINTAGDSTSNMIFGTGSSTTERMRIDSSGNVGIGNSSPTVPLRIGTDASTAKVAISASVPAADLSSSTLVTFGTNMNGVITNIAVGSTNGYGGGYWIDNGTTQAGIASTRPATANWGSDLRFYTHPANTSNISTTTEVGRFDPSGNLLVGCTALGAAGGFGVGPNSGSSFIDICHVTGTASGTAYARFFFDSSQIGSITQSGTTAVLYNVTSDQRLKENIVDAPEFGGVIDSLQVRSFNWKTDQTHQRAGFIAQELVTVAPEAVHQPTDPEDMMAVDYSKLVPMLVKEIQSLRIRLAALEAA